ncbi:MAG: HAMP domain-containing histidine kinase, partial [Desulfobacterales bacterium]|nr:HAMP domain-containing histidine kinase [Desulfobacterales bacterium]
KRELALISEIDDNMPPIPADPAGLHQAIINLVNNAIDAVEPGTGAVTVRCQYMPIEQIATITGSDNGHGIEADDERLIFQPFYSTKGQRGTGLGLAVTRKIVDEHGGRIALETGPDEGTTFTIELSTQHAADPSETTT